MVDDSLRCDRRSGVRPSEQRGKRDARVKVSTTKSKRGDAGLLCQCDGRGKDENVMTASGPDPRVYGLLTANCPRDSSGSRSTGAAVGDLRSETVSYGCC
jgi:hypothetical protein